MLRYDPSDRISAADALKHEFFRMRRAPRSAAAAGAVPNGRARQAISTPAAALPAIVSAPKAPTGSGTAEAAVKLGGSVGGKGGSSQVTECTSVPKPKQAPPSQQQQPPDPPEAAKQQQAEHLIEELDAPVAEEEGNR